MERRASFASLPLSRSNSLSTPVPVTPSSPMNEKFARGLNRIKSAASLANIVTGLSKSKSFVKPKTPSLELSGTTPELGMLALVADELRQRTNSSYLQIYLHDSVSSKLQVILQIFKSGADEKELHSFQSSMAVKDDEGLPGICFLTGRSVKLHDQSAIEVQMADSIEHDVLFCPLAKDSSSPTNGVIQLSSKTTEGGWYSETDRNLGVIFGMILHRILLTLSDQYKQSGTQNTTNITCLLPDSTQFSAYPLVLRMATFKKSSKYGKKLSLPLPSKKKASFSENQGPDSPSSNSPDVSEKIVASAVSGIHQKSSSSSSAAAASKSSPSPPRSKSAGGNNNNLNFDSSSGYNEQIEQSWKRTVRKCHELQAQIIALQFDADADKRRIQRLEENSKKLAAVQQENELLSIRMRRMSEQIERYEKHQHPPPPILKSSSPQFSAYGESFSSFSVIEDEQLASSLAIRPSSSASSASAISSSRPASREESVRFKDSAEVWDGNVKLERAISSPPNFPSATVTSALISDDMLVYASAAAGAASIEPDNSGNNNKDSNLLPRGNARSAVQALSADRNPGMSQAQEWMMMEEGGGLPQTHNLHHFMSPTKNVKLKRDSSIPSSNSNNDLLFSAVSDVVGMMPVTRPYSSASTSFYSSSSARSKSPSSTGAAASAIMAAKHLAFIKSPIATCILTGGYKIWKANEAAMSLLEAEDEALLGAIDVRKNLGEKNINISPENDCVSSILITLQMRPISATLLLKPLHPEQSRSKAIPLSEGLKLTPTYILVILPLSSVSSD